MQRYIYLVTSHMFRHYTIIWKKLLILLAREQQSKMYLPWMQCPVTDRIVLY